MRISNKNSKIDKAMKQDNENNDSNNIKIINDNNHDNNIKINNDNNYDNKNIKMNVDNNNNTNNSNNSNNNNNIKINNDDNSDNKNIKMNVDNDNNKNNNKNNNTNNDKPNKKRRSTFTVLFYVNRDKVKQNGLCPVMGRITIDTKVAQFSTKTDIDSTLWDTKTGRAIGKSSQSILVNRAIDRLTHEINKAYTELVDKQGYVTAELVKNALYGIGRKQEMLLKLFDEHNLEFKLRVGVNRVENTYSFYLLSYRHLFNFIKQKYGMEDIALDKLKLNFIDAYDFYLRVVRQMTQNTILGHLIVLKKMIRRAVHQGILKGDPFVNYVAEQPEKLCRHLKSEEIDKIMQVHIESKKVCHTRDMFVFCCFTGLAYSDIRNLSQGNITTQLDGSLWISIKRQKTKGECNIRLLDIPKQIIDKYRNDRKSDKIFNMISLASICRNLEKIAVLCGIEHITFHMARHNFGTHITLSQGVPIETVSRMMGHRSIATTQIYAKITNKKVNEDMKLLSERITDKYAVFEDKTMPIGIKLNQNFKRNKEKQQEK
jgi:site-specific recombinase XerD